jgi:hypothetical protein
MTQKSEFEVRLSVIKHMSQMLLEMADVDFDNLPKDEEEMMLEDFEEVAGHLLDALGFKPSNSEDGVHFTANFTMFDPEEYIARFLENEEGI